MSRPMSRSTPEPQKSARTCSDARVMHFCLQSCSHCRNLGSRSLLLCNPQKVLAAPEGNTLAQQWLNMDFSNCKTYFPLGSTQGNGCFLASHLAAGASATAVGSPQTMSLPALPGWLSKQCSAKQPNALEDATRPQFPLV